MTTTKPIKKLVLLFVITLSALSCSEEKEDNVTPSTRSNTPTTTNDQKELLTEISGYWVANIDGVNAYYHFDNETLYYASNFGQNATEEYVFTEGTYTAESSVATLSQSGENITAIENSKTYIFKPITKSEFEAIWNQNLSPQEKEEKEINNLYKELVELSQSQNCTNSQEWKFTHYGSTSCGGPVGYIPYSKKIDTTAFLKLVEEHINLQGSYNNKYGIYSSCDIAVAPTDIICEEGKATLVY